MHEMLSLRLTLIVSDMITATTLTQNDSSIATEEMYITTTKNTVRRSLSCKDTAEILNLWKCSNRTWQNQRFNMETDDSSVCHSLPGEILCEIDLDIEESNYIFCCSKANIGSPNVATKCYNITVTAMPSCKD